MADDADLAQDRIEKTLDANIAACRAALLSGAGTGECVECGEEIPDDRQRAVPGCERCIDCQEKFEKTKRR